MIWLKYIRNNPEEIKDSIKKRWGNIDIDAFLKLDREVVDLKNKLDELRAVKNTVSKEIPKLQNEEKQAKIKEMKEIWENIKTLESTLWEKEEIFFNMHIKIPNILDESTSVWETDEDNVLESKFMEPTKFDFTPKPHYEIWEKKWWIDTEKGSEICGSRFWYIKWDLVLLQFALVNYAMSKLVWEEKFEPILPPVLVKERAMFWTWYFPADEDWVYAVNPWDDDLYLVWTAEVPVTSYHSWEIMDLDEPKKYVWYSSCFRREAWSAWKDTRWILRWHQFEKVEMVCFCKPSDSRKVHDYMVKIEEDIWQWLKIPYQKMNVCSWDLWNPAMKKYDLEAWMPWQEKYREVTSCSNVWEYQARRLWIRYREEDWTLETAHTLNGTVIAIWRCLIAIIENYQTENGDVMIPEVLRPYMFWKDKI